MDSKNVNIHCDDCESENKSEEVHQLTTFGLQTLRRLGRRPLKLGLIKRKDLVYKCLLRRIRKFYWEDFNFQTGFSSIIAEKNHLSYYDYVCEYLAYGLNMPVTNEYVFAVGSLISKCHMKNFINSIANNIYPLDYIQR